MKEKYSMVWLILLLLGSIAFAQDEIVLKNGDIIKAKVSEVGTDQIKYKKWENLEGPTYSSKKDEVFMIKYENGSKDVFSASQKTSTSTTVQTSSSDGGPATIYIIRPKKMAASSPEIIVGTVVPDEVVTKVRNGRWYKAPYGNFGPVEFVTGVYSINPVHSMITLFI